MGAHDAENLAKMLAGKLRALPPAAVAEIEAFIETIAARSQDRGLVRAAAVSSEASFRAIWNNPEDDIYDAL
jgi:hypothetical protein